MILACPQCRKRYRTDPGRIPPGGGFVRCPACRARIEVRPAEAESERSVAAPIGPPPALQTPSPAVDAPPAFQVVEPQAPEPPREGPPAPEVFIRTDGGSYIARDLEEVRKWVLQGRLVREDLISHAGGPEVRADLHPLTRHFFDLLQAHETAETGAPAMAEILPGAPAMAEILPGAPAMAEVPPGAPEEEAVIPAPPVAAETPGDGAGAPATEETAAESPGRLPGNVRAIAVLNFLLSLFPTLSPVGIVAAFGLLRARAWGRALTLFWAMTTFLALVAGAVLYARGTLFLDLSVAVVAAALAAYLLIVLVTLTRKSVAARFQGGGSLAAVLLALLFYFALGGFIATGALKNGIERLWPHPAAPRVPPTPRVAAPLPAPAPPPPTEFTEGRAFTAEGLASMEVVPGWTVRKVTGGEPAKLGVLLEGERSVPAGTLRFITATPAELEKQDQRFDRVDAERGEIKDVEVVRRGEFTGRKIVTAFPVKGGINGSIVLSLHDGDRGYQFRCGSKGPFFETIRPECERMAASVLLSTRTAAPAPNSPPAGP